VKRDIRRRTPALRSRERGNAIVLATIIVTALGTLGVLTTVSVRSGTATTASDRFHLIARYAAESGGAAAMSYLRSNLSISTKWSPFVEAPTSVLVPVPHFASGIVGNNILPGATGNPFTPAMNAWYYVEIYNNRDDNSYLAGDDSDARVIIRSTGHGPDGATSIIEWEVTMQATNENTPCDDSGQKNQNASNNAYNHCLNAINTADTEVLPTP
jgi:hypothetical protein